MTVLQNVSRTIGKMMGHISLKQTKDSLRVTEGVSGLLHYHLSEEGEYTGLCGAAVMNSDVPMDNWKSPSDGSHHRRATYCKTCDAASQRFQKELA